MERKTLDLTSIIKLLVFYKKTYLLISTKFAVLDGSTNIGGKLKWKIL